MPETLPIVAIDGPAGAGKSTVSRLVAQRLGYTLLDTGALYRCVAVAAERAGATAPEDIARVAEDLARRSAIRFEPHPDGHQVVWLDDQDVSEAIRTQAAGQGASRASAIPGVRTALLDMQRSIGGRGGVVVEGRDIGTVVFPESEAKFFLTASVDERAQRRHKELAAKSEGLDGEVPSLATVRQEVEERDRRDSSRPVAPLRQAADAVLVDSTGLDIDAVVEQIVSRVRRIAVDGSHDD